ncbi:MAG: phage terminase large subunit [Bacillota bacterium]|nr:phage terminase large subunit [Bacillota bacterium]
MKHSSKNRLSKKIPCLESVKQEIARRSLLDFTTYTFPGYETNWHHELLCNKLDQLINRKIKRLMVFMPPRHGKSELGSRRLPAYALGRNPDESIIAASYSADLASRMNRDVQRIIDTPEYRDLFPETQLFGKNIRTNAQGAYLRNSEIFEVVGRRGLYRSAGVGGGITGMGCTFGVIDDPIKNRAEADSQTFRNAIWDWYTSTFYTRLEKDAVILIILTRWHEDDLAGRLLEQAKADPTADQWEVVDLQAIKDVDKPGDPRQMGEALWPGKYTLEDLNRIKAVVGSRDWEALYQQRPAPAEGNIINRGWWQFYRQKPTDFDFGEVIQSWDCAFKDKNTSDFVVGQVWGRKGANKYLLDQVRGRMDLPATMAAIQTLSAKWPNANAKLIEDKANGPAVIQMLRNKVSGLIAVEPQGGKIVRAQAITPDIEAGNVYLPDPSIAPWVHDFIEECSAFPNGSHDDQVDAMSQALTRLGKVAELQTGDLGLGNW